MSAWLTTPSGRPDSSITGAALMPRLVSRMIASWTVALSRIEMGLVVIRSAAVSAPSHSCGAVSRAVVFLMAGPRYLPGLREDLQPSPFEGCFRKKICKSCARGECPHLADRAGCFPHDTAATPLFAGQAAGYN